jgi:outer membrane murein-binding lipoprotein Lpp
MFKQRLMVAATVLGGLFLSGCQNQAPEANTTANTNMTANTAAAKTADPRIVEEVKKMLAAHDKLSTIRILTLLWRRSQTTPRS